MKAQNRLNLALSALIIFQCSLSLGVTNPVSSKPSKLTKTLNENDFLKLLKENILAKGGGFDAGGGDYVRATFLQVGHSVLKYLKDSEKESHLLEKNNLSIEQLQSALDVNVVATTDQVLIDRTGSLVDSLGKPNLILLSESRWLNHFEKEKDVYYLVLHEMLREVGFNDDNYIVSKNIYPFSEKHKVKTRHGATSEMIADDSLSQIILTDKLVYGGTGCPSDEVGTQALFDKANNQIEIYPSQLKQVVGVPNLISRKACMLAVPIEVPAGYQIEVTQVDMTGEVHLQKNTSAQLTINQFLAGNTSVANPENVKKILSDKEMFGRVILRTDSTFKTECGQSGIFRLSAESFLNNSSSNPNESYFLTDKITLSIRKKKCSAEKVK